MSDNSIWPVCLELMATGQLAYYYLKRMNEIDDNDKSHETVSTLVHIEKKTNEKHTRNIEINYTCLPTISSVSWLSLPKSVGRFFSNLLLSIYLTISNKFESQTNLNETIQCTQSYLQRLSFSSRYSSPVLGGIVPENKFSSVIHRQEAM